MSVTYKEGVRQALFDAMRADERLLFIGPEVQDPLPASPYHGLAKEFGTDRVRDTAISESAAVGLAVGAAMNGYRTIVDIAYADVAAVCFSSLVQMAAKIRYLTNGGLSCPVVLRAPIGRFARHGPMGAQVTASWFGNVPDLRIVMPATPQEAYWGLRSALAEPIPTIFLEERCLYGRSGEVSQQAPRVGASVLRSGGQLTLLGAGRAAAVAVDAAEALAADGVEAEVLSLWHMRPLDVEGVLSSAKRTRRLVIVQDEPLAGGYAPVVRCLLDTLPVGTLRCPPAMIGAPDEHIPYLGEEEFFPTVRGVVEAARVILERS